LFAIDSSTGQIRLTAAGAAFIDFEATTKSYMLTVNASDGLPAHDQTETVVINLTNVNEPPVLTVGSNGCLWENAAAGAITGAVVTATDPEGDPITFSLSDPSFAIDSNGQISVTAAGLLDFEVFGTPYILQVTASDGLAATTETVKIILGDVAPVF